MRKVFFTLGAIVVVAAGVALYFIIFRFDSVLESRIERAATTAMGSHVEVHGVKTSLRNGTLTVEQISVANPPGFENPYAARFNGVEAAVDYQQREIKRLVIDRPEFLIEEADGETNFGQLLRALEAGGDSGTPAAEGGAEEDAEDGADEGAAGGEPEIVVRHFRINATRAAFESRSLERYSDVEVDAIEMNDLRGTPSELAEQIARVVVAEISSEAATEMLKAKAKKQFNDTSELVDRKIRELLDSDGDGEADAVDGEPDTEQE